MSEPTRDRYEQWQVEAVLQRYAGLRIVPARADELRFAGALAFHVTGPDGETIEDQYDVDVRVSPRFPTAVPMVLETGGRIDDEYHKLEGGALCLGSPTALRMMLKESPTLLTFVERILIPYLYGYSYFVRHGTMPYGQLDHRTGIRDFIAETFGACGGANPEEFLRLAGLQRHRANKHFCPCGSGLRLGRCHNRSVNNFRKRLGRLWCRDEYVRVAGVFQPRSLVSGLFLERNRMVQIVKRSA